MSYPPGAICKTYRSYPHLHNHVGSGVCGYCWQRIELDPGCVYWVLTSITIVEEEL